MEVTYLTAFLGKDGSSSKDGGGASFLLADDDGNDVDDGRTMISMFTQMISLLFGLSSPYAMLAPNHTYIYVYNKYNRRRNPAREEIVPSRLHHAYSSRPLSAQSYSLCVLFAAEEKAQ